MELTAIIISSGLFLQHHLTTIISWKLERHRVNISKEDFMRSDRNTLINQSDNDVSTSHRYQSVNDVSTLPGETVH